MALSLLAFAWRGWGAGLSTGLGTLSTADGKTGVFAIDYSDTVGGSAIGLISRCGGGEFTLIAQGAYGAE